MDFSMKKNEIYYLQQMDKIGKYHVKIHEPNIESQVHSFMWKTKVRKCASLKEEGY